MVYVDKDLKIQLKLFYSYATKKVCSSSINSSIFVSARAFPKNVKKNLLAAAQKKKKKTVKKIEKAKAKIDSGSKKTTVRN